RRIVAQRGCQREGCRRSAPRHPVLDGRALPRGVLCLGGGWVRRTGAGKRREYDPADDQSALRVYARPTCRGVGCGTAVPTRLVLDHEACQKSDRCLSHGGVPDPGCGGCLADTAHVGVLTSRLARAARWSAPTPMVSSTSRGPHFGPCCCIGPLPGRGG